MERLIQSLVAQIMGQGCSSILKLIIDPKSLVAYQRQHALHLLAIFLRREELRASLHAGALGNM
jgi:hypothetical protein